MINNCADLLTAVDLKARATEISSRNDYGRSDEAKGPVEIHKLYINYLPYDIVVVEANGFRHTVPKNSKMGKTGFIVRTIYTIGFPMVSKSVFLNNGYRGLPSDDVALIANVAELNVDRSQFNKITVGIDRVVLSDDLDRVSGNMYLVDADIVISTLAYEKAPGHPRAMGTVSENFFDQTLTANTNGLSFGIGVEMVNRKHGAEPMYTYVANTVRRIPVCKTKTKPEGFYVTTLELDLDGESRQKLISNFYQLEQANSIGVYKSVDEALTSGNIKMLREEEITKLKHEADMWKAQNGLDKAKLDQEHEMFMLTHNKNMADLAESAKKANAEKAEELRIAIHDTWVMEQQFKEAAAELIRQDKQKELEHESAMRRIKEDAALSIRNHDEYSRMQQISYDERERNHKLQIMALDKEREGLKDYYSTKSDKRKDSQEVLKIITATITTMGIMLLAYNKAFGK